MNGINNNSVPLVFVWLGSTLPEWARESMRLSTRLSGVSTILLADKSIIISDEVDCKIPLQDFYANRFSNKIFSESTLQFWDGFWQKTTERFYVLKDFQKKYCVSSFFHAEIDNLVFGIEKLGKKLNQFGVGFFCPRETVDRGIASLVYCNDSGVLEEITETFSAGRAEIRNDMMLLGYLFRYSNKFFALPTERSFATLENSTWRSLDPDAIHGIFDAAALGQYLFGVDPRIVPGPVFNRYDNPNCGCDLSRLKFSVFLDGSMPTVSSSDGVDSYPLYNIHVHSKAFEKIINGNFLKMLIKRINRNKKMMIFINFMRWRFIRKIWSRQ